MTQLSLAFLVLAAFSGGRLRADDTASGPAVGDKVAALKVFDATGTHQGKEVDYAADRKDKPTVYLFVQGDRFSRPMARFMRELDKAVAKDFEDAAVVAVWLSEDVAKTKEYLPRAQQSVQFGKTALTVFPGERSGPGDWHVNPDAHLTAVVAARGKVAFATGYQSVNETDVPRVKEALAKAAKGK